jgi:hypothetical protein
MKYSDFSTVSTGRDCTLAELVENQVISGKSGVEEKVA